MDRSMDRSMNTVTSEELRGRLPGRVRPARRGSSAASRPRFAFGIQLGIRLAILIAVIGSTASVSFAGSYAVFRATSIEGRPGDAVEIGVNAETMYTTQTWSFGLCHDSAVAQVLEVFPGATTAVVNGGMPPDFMVVEIYSGGWTAGVVISFLGSASLPAGDDHELHRAVYELTGSAGDGSELEFCPTLGQPPVAVVVSSGGASIVPATDSGALHIVEASFAYTAPVHTAPYSAAGTQQTQVTFDVETFDDGTTWVTEGLSFSLAYPPDRLTPLSVAPTALLETLTGGLDFFGLAIFPEGIAGQIVYDSSGGLVVDSRLSVFEVEFQTDLPDLRGRIDPLIWVDGIGVPFVLNEVQAGGASLPVVRRHGQIRWTEGPTTVFLRGDCDGSGAIDLGDAVEMLEYLFITGQGNCLAACDVENSGVIDIADPLFLLSYSFQGGPAPPAPFPNCDADDDFPCDDSGC